MKDKIKAALKTKYATLGLGDKAFDGVAAVLAKTVSKEDEIQGVVDDALTLALLKSIQSESDTYRTKNTELQKEYDEYKKAHPETDPKPDPNKTDPKPDAALAAALARIEALENANKESANKLKRETLLSDVRKKLKDQGCDSDFILNYTIKNATIKDDEELDAIVTRLKADYDTAYSEAYGEGVVPPAGSRQQVPDKPEDDDAFFDQMRAEGKFPSKEKTE